jgi:CTP:molybdopterin cytidylyltransferase MocA
MGFPKALLEFKGERFVDRLVRLFNSVCGQVVVVRSALSGEWRVADAEVVENPDPARGMLSSLQCGLRTVSPSADAIFFTPVDYPAIAQTTVTQMSAAWNSQSVLVLPRAGGRRGHPVLISRVVATEFLSLPAGAQARDVVHRRESDIRYVDVEDPGILLDIDDPEQYRALTAETLS